MFLLKLCNVRTANKESKKNSDYIHVCLSFSKLLNRKDAIIWRGKKHFWKRTRYNIFSVFLQQVG